MNSLDSKSELFTKLYDQNILGDIENIRAGKKNKVSDEEEIEESTNYYTKSNCISMKDKLGKIIKNSGPFTLTDALTLEYCRKDKKTHHKPKDFKKDLDTLPSSEETTTVSS